VGIFHDLFMLQISSTMHYVKDMKREGILLWTTVDQYRLLSVIGDSILHNGSKQSRHVLHT